MARTTWFLGTLLLGTLAGCGGNSADDDGSGSGVDGSIPADGSQDQTAPADASNDVPSITPVSDAGSDGTVFEGGAPAVSPSSLDFGLVNCGSTAAAQTFKVSNPAQYDVTWTATLGLGAASPFQIAPAGGTLTPQQSVDVTVTPSAVPAAALTAANAFGDVVSVSLNSTTSNVALTETAQGAILGFQPAAVAFGPVPLSLGPQGLYFAVQNSGNLAASVGLTLSGDPAFTLPDAGTTETLTTTGGAIVDSEITYTPTTTTTATGSVALALVGTTALCGPLPTALPISGTGTNGQIGVTPATIVFGNNGLVPCGTTALPASVSVENTGSASVNWTAVLTHGSSFYTVAPASGTVLPGTTTPVVVTPKPIPATSATTAGEYDDTLTVTTNSAGDVPHVVSLQETAQGAILTRVGSLGFGSVGVGAVVSNTTSISFSNTGNVDATLAFANGSSVFVQTSPLTLPAGTFATEDVTFSPTATVAYTDIGTVTLDSTEDGGTIPLCAALPGSLTLTGTGTQPTVTPSPTSLNFGDIPCGQAAPNPLVVSITNNGPTTSYNAGVLKGVGSFFQVTPIQGQINAGQTLPFTVTGKAIPMPGSTTANAYGDTLQIVTGLGNIVDVALNQTALGAVLAFTGTGTTAFGLETSGSMASMTLTVTNSGTAPATVTLTPSTNFGVSPMTPTSVPQGGGWPFNATFTPPSPGPYTGTMTLSVSNTLLCAALPVPEKLTGTGN
jgi:hypothetical protein